MQSRRLDFGLDSDASIEDIRAIAENYPVFRVVYLEATDELET